MAPPDPPKRKLRRLILLILVGLVGLLLWLILREGTKPVAKPDEAPRPKAGTAAARIDYGRPPPGKAAFDPTKLGPFDEHEPAPIIDEIIVEKKEVCEGEENLITIKAHTTNGTDAFLHYDISGNQGMPHPLRVYLGVDTPDRPFPQSVRVFGRGNVATEIPDITDKFKVKKCQPLRAADINYRLAPNTFSEYDFVVAVSDVGAKDNPNTRPFKPVSYRWDFGDGTINSTQVPAVSHSYDARPQETLYSYYIVRVDALGEDGEKVTGRKSVVLLNPAFEDLAYKGVVTILAIPTNPRFPEVNEDGHVNQGFRIWHARPDPVAVTKIAVTRFLEVGNEAAGERHPEKGDVDSILGQHDIPPGGIEIVVSQKAKVEPNWSMVRYDMEGVSVEGWPARGSFTVMMPTVLPTPENHKPVTDPLEVAKILEAQKILGRKYVSDEDIWRLEREGKLAGVKPDPKLKIKTLPRGAPSPSGGDGQKAPPVPPPPPPPPPP